MLGMLVNLMVRVCLAVVELAVRLALALGLLAGRVLVLVLGAVWQAWRARQAAVREDASRAAPEAARRPPVSPVAFTPRPLRRRPGR